MSNLYKKFVADFNHKEPNGEDRPIIGVLQLGIKTEEIETDEQRQLSLEIIRLYKLARAEIAAAVQANKQTIIEELTEEGTTFRGTTDNGVRTGSWIARDKKDAIVTIRVGTDTVGTFTGLAGKNLNTPDGVIFFGERIRVGFQEIDSGFVIQSFTHYPVINGEIV